MQETKAHSVDELSRLIAEGNPDPDAPGPVFRTITLWDGRVVRGSYYKGDLQPHIFDLHDILLDQQTVDRLVKQLLIGGFTGSSFIAETGESDMVCRMIWEISNN